MPRGYVRRNFSKLFVQAAGGEFTAPELEVAQGSTQSSTYVDLINITGGGILYWLIVHGDDGMGVVQLTIDGHAEAQIFDTTYKYIANQYFAASSGFISLIASSTLYYFRAYFQDSLQIEFKKSTATNAYAKAIYGVI